MVETEQVLQEAHDAGTFSHTHLRYPLLWGPGQLAPREWSIVRRVLDGRGVIPVVDGARTLESRCFVTNAAAGVLAAVDHPEASAGRTYNVADDYTPDDERRVKDLCTALGKPDMRLANFPQQVTGPAGFWGVGRDLTATPMIPASTRHRVVSTARIRSELGHRDVITYEDAVRVTAHHYRSEPLELGGAQELKLGDPFDYAAEDALLRELVAFEDRAAEVGFSGGGFVHQYDHPPAPGT
jgi:nucleoside-diphosphate-sugar epimerase